ncbi:hypothetical protein [Streptodolium elevatio]|uniref:7-carboxy-7-deazaguanine synthase n=1 Tax=Streptodolium elevatio TaxID=3157996 RepID=A0ABV3D9I6_9ACTN
MTDLVKEISCTLQRDPQPGGDAAQFEDLDFHSFRLQPADGPAAETNTEATVEYCIKNPRWIFSLQTHKYLGIQ